MKRTLGRMKRTLSVLLAAAMIFTALPQTSALAYAAETQNASDEGGGIADSDRETGGADSAGQAAGEERKEDEPGEAKLEETGLEDIGSEEIVSSEEQPAEDQADSEGSVDSDEKDSESLPDADEAGSDGEGTEEPDTPENSEGITVNIQLPNKDNKALIENLEYAVVQESGAEKFVELPWTPEEGDDSAGTFTVAISNVAKGSILKLKPTMVDHAKITSVKYGPQSSETGTEKDDAEESDGIYTVDIAEDASECQVSIEATRYYTLKFVGKQGSEAADEGAAKLFRYEISSQPDSDDIIGTEIEVPEEDWEQHLEKYYYKAEVAEGYTLKGVEADTKEFSIDTVGNDDDKTYCFVKGSSVGSVPGDITVTVKVDKTEEAEETNEHKLTFAIPAALTSKIDLKVSIDSEDCELTDNEVSVPDGKTVSFQVVMQNDKSHAVTCKKENDTSFLPVNAYDGIKEEGEGWVFSYTLGTLDADIVININEINMYKVNFVWKDEKVGAVNVYSPADKECKPGVNENSVPVYVMDGEKLQFSLQAGEGTDCIASTAEDMGAEMESRYDEVHSTEIYEVTPAGDMDIYLGTKPETKTDVYPLTFTYPDAVKTVTVKDYTLQDNKINVEAGRQIDFKVELADETYQITSVTMNGVEAEFDSASGYYRITTVEGAMEVVIRAAEIENEKVTIETTSIEDEKDRLIECIEEYQGYDQDDYTPESWTAFANALKAAQECRDNPNATVTQINAAIDALNRAADALEWVERAVWIYVEDEYYTGSAVKPYVEVYSDDEWLELEEKRDYTISYKNNVNAGKATVIVNGKGNYSGKYTKTFNILKIDLSDDWGDIETEDTVYAVIDKNGKLKNPKITMKYGKKTLKEGTDYSVTYPDIPKDAAGKPQPGYYTIKVEAKKKDGSDALNYKGSRIITYRVLSNDTVLLEKAKVTLSAKKVAYNGTNTERPQVMSVKVGGKDVPKDAYSVGYDYATLVGKASVILTAKENSGYYGTTTVDYIVEGTKLSTSKFNIEGIEKSYAYTGNPIFAADTLRISPKDAPSTVLRREYDYAVYYFRGKEYDDFTGDAGTITVVIKGMRAYTGTIKKTFKITPVDLDKDKTAVRLNASGTAVYNKNGAKPSFTLYWNNRLLRVDRDYTVSYSGNTKVVPGQQSATMTIKGKGNYKGSISCKYEVTPASADRVYVSAADIAVPDQFKKLKTTVKVTERGTGKALKAGTDYEKEIKYYSDSACTRQITAENFAGLQLKADSVVYAQITMKGNYAGTGSTPGHLVAGFRLFDDSKNLSKGGNFVIKVQPELNTEPKIYCDSKGNPYYRGEGIYPKVTVTPKGSTTPLVEGRDYEVIYSNNDKKGKATATVIGIGNGYGGSMSVKFTIVPMPVDFKFGGSALQKAMELFKELTATP